MRCAYLFMLIYLCSMSYFIMIGLSEESFMAEYVEITYDEIQEEIQTEFREILLKVSMNCAYY